MLRHCNKNRYDCGVQTHSENAYSEGFKRVSATDDRIMIPGLQRQGNSLLHEVNTYLKFYTSVSSLFQLAFRLKCNGVHVRDQ